MGDPDVLDVVDRQVAAFNAHDLEAFCACYGSEVVARGIGGDVLSIGIGPFRDAYAEQFERLPDLTVRVTGRLVLGQWVVDREALSTGGIERVGGAAYAVRGGRISEVVLFPLQERSPAP